MHNDTIIKGKYNSLFLLFHYLAMSKQTNCDCDESQYNPKQQDEIDLRVSMAIHKLTPAICDLPDPDCTCDYSKRITISESDIQVLMKFRNQLQNLITRYSKSG